MKRIYYKSEVAEWFQQNFGYPSKWGGTIEEPVALKHSYYWATGWHSRDTYTEAIPVIWCNEKAYMLYLLRWSK